MSIQWTLIAAFLYAEVALVVLLVLPVASPQRWQRLFKSRFLSALSNQAQYYFMILMAVLILFFLEAIREMRKYTNPEEGTHQHVDAEVHVNMRLFRAQRNFYISGFALFLSLVIRRLITFISTQATLLAESEAALRQAKSATTTAQSLLSQSNSSTAQNDANKTRDKQVKALKGKVQELERTLASERKDKEALKSQAESTNAQYDRLAEEHRKLQNKITAEGGDFENKKAA